MLGEGKLYEQLMEQFDNVISQEKIDKMSTQQINFDDAIGEKREKLDS